MEELFRRFDQQGVVYCVLREYENLPSLVGNDADLLLHAAHSRLAAAIIGKTAADLGWALIRECDYYGVHRYTWAQASDEAAIQCVNIDVSVRLSWNSFEWGAAGAVLLGRRRRSCFYIPSHGAEAAVSLMQNYLGYGWVKEKYKQRISSFAAQDVEGFRGVLTPTFGARWADRILKCCLASDWEGLARVSRRVKAALVLHALAHAPVRQLARLLHWAVRNLRQDLFSDTGLFIAIMGPDGAGKTTAASALADRLVESKVFRKSCYYHGHFRILPKLKVFRNVFSRSGGRRKPGAGVEETTVPSRTAVHSLPRAMAYLCYYGLEYLLGHVWVCASRRRGELVIADRYIYDYGILRGFEKLPMWFVRGVSRLVPCPDLVVYLHCSPEGIHTRKKELPLEEIAWQQGRCIEWLQHVPNARQVSTEGPLPQALAELQDLVLAKLSSRKAKRGQT